MTPVTPPEMRAAGWRLLSRLATGEHPPMTTEELITELRVLADDGSKAQEIAGADLEHFRIFQITRH